MNTEERTQSGMKVTLKTANIDTQIGSLQNMHGGCFNQLYSNVLLWLIFNICPLGLIEKLEELIAGLNFHRFDFLSSNWFSTKRGITEFDPVFRCISVKTLSLN